MSQKLSRNKIEEELKWCTQKPKSCRVCFALYILNNLSLNSTVIQWTIILSWLLAIKQEARWCSFLNGFSNKVTWLNLKRKPTLIKFLYHHSHRSCSTHTVSIDCLHLENSLWHTRHRVIMGDISWIHPECESKRFIYRSIECAPGWAWVIFYGCAG